MNNSVLAYERRSDESLTLTALVHMWLKFDLNIVIIII